MPQPKVSVIVPVYNVARYLPQCLDSLRSQTLQDMEILLVNDGSTDGSAEILRAYAAQDWRFRLIERPNGGYSAARNTGLKEVRGDFVGFVDADDWVEPDMFEHLLSLAETHHADLVQSGFDWYLEQEGRHVPKDNSWIPPLLARSGGSLRGAEAILFEDIAIWKKLYRRSLLEAGALSFDEGMPMGEDVPFHLSALCLAGRIAASDRPLYHYRKQRPGQQTGITDQRLLAYFRIFEKMEELIQQHGLTYLQPWLLHLQLSRHCWGYEMAAPDVRGAYFQRIHATFQQAGITPRSPIAPGCWRYGSAATRLRWFSLRFLHPMALRAIQSGDQKRFDRVIRWRVALQDPKIELARMFSN
jgi:hypothetical protein